MEKLFKNNGGFTIIEIVISMFIIAIAIVGIFTALSIVVILTSDSADRLTATYLAQEGMEIVRNIRDTNWIKIQSDPATGIEHSWIDGLTSAGDPSIDCVQGCEADYTTGTGVLLPSPMKPWSLNDYLCIDENGFYANSSTCSQPAKFKRRIIITCLPDNDCAKDYIMKVVVQVSWKKKSTILGDGTDAFSNSICSGSNCVTAEETLYNWY